MNLLHHSIFCLSLTGSIGLNACQQIDPVIYECEQLLEKINEIVLDAQNITESEKSNDTGEINLEVWLQAADVLDAGSLAIADLSITTAPLNSYQTQISKIYGDQAQATYDMVKARQQKNLEIALAAQKRTAEAGDREQKTGEALNQYCQAKEQELNAP